MIPFKILYNLIAMKKNKNNVIGDWLDNHGNEKISASFSYHAPSRNNGTSPVNMYLLDEAGHCPTPYVKHPAADYYDAMRKDRDNDYTFKSPEPIQEQVLAEIRSINETFPNPQCYLVALLLSSKFGGRILHNSDHCVTLINGTMYDRDGVAEEGELKFLDLEEYGIKIKRTLVDALVENYELRDV